MTASNRSLIDLDALGELFADRIATAQELITIGLSSNSVYARCRPGGPWQRLLPGVLLLSSSGPTRRQLVRAALRFAGAHAILTGRDATQLHGLRTAPAAGPVHVLIPADRQVRSDSGVRVERTTRIPKPVMRQGILTAPVTRSALDSARTMRAVDDVRALLAEAVQRRFVTPEALSAELALGSQRGSALPRKVLAEIDDGVRSAAEAWARRLVLRSVLPKPQWNVRLSVGNEPLGVADAWWDTVGLAWEIDSYAFHLSPDSYANTLKHHSRMTAAGVMVVHTLPDRLRKEPKAVVDELADAYRQAGLRPRPDVSSEPWS